MDGKLIEMVGRHFMAVCKSGRPRGARQAPVFHAVTPACRIALCGAEPAPRSNWAEPSDQVTCAECLARLARLAGAANGRPAPPTRRP